jgi:hypothetical protein
MLTCAEIEALRPLTRTRDETPFVSAIEVLLDLRGDLVLGEFVGYAKGERAFTGRIRLAATMLQLALHLDAIVNRHVRWIYFPLMQTVTAGVDQTGPDIVVQQVALRLADRTFDDSRGGGGHEPVPFFRKALRSEDNARRVPANDDIVTTASVQLCPPSALAHLGTFRRRVGKSPARDY